MKCEICKTNLTEQDKFCPVCGRKVENNSNYQTNNNAFNNGPYDQYQNQGGYNQQQYNQYQNSGYNQGYPQPPKSGGDGMLKMLLAIGIILLMIAIGALIFMLVSSRSSSETEVTEATQDKSGVDSDEKEVEEDEDDDDQNGTVIINSDVDSSKSDNVSSSNSSNSSSSSGKTSGYIISGSNSRYLTSSDLSSLSSWELKLARNEIYARHGRRFNDSDIQAYFDSKDWYSGTISPENFSDSVLNEYESSNAIYIKQYEKGTAPSSASSVNSSSSSGSGSSGSSSLSSGYILPNSSTSYLSESDIAGLSSSQLRLARNEIYARHGRRFNSSDLQSYFDAQSWYSGTVSADSFNEDILSSVEKSNIDFIAAHE